MDNHIENDERLVLKLSIKAIDLAGIRVSEIDRYCWMVVHEHIHGAMPVEYESGILMKVSI